MGESAVLGHSFSFAAPITPKDSHEDNTIHALSQSISFGRFMTENLEWGKWSSFSHKKYVEEAVKYSQPGSVAEKKAFFEAHYKRIAEAKAAAAAAAAAAAEEQSSAEVFLHTLEEDDEESEERQSTQIDDNKLVLVDDSLVVNDLTDEFEEKENSVKGNNLIDDKDKEKKEEWSDSEKKKNERRSMSKNKSVFRLSLEKTIPPKSVDTETDISVSDKTSERPMIRSSEKIEEKKPVNRRRFSFCLNCFMCNAKTQDQNHISKKRKTEKKKKKKFLCFSLKTKTVRES